MSKWLTRGDLLRWWRTDVTGLSQRAMAEALGVGRTSVTNWEKSSRTFSLDLSDIDAATGAQGSLASLLWAFNAPEGLNATTFWTHVFRGDSTPVWMWIRSDNPHIKLMTEWGVFRCEIDRPMPPNGIFIKVGASIDNAPILVALSEPGWVDFGRGPLPDKIDDADVVSALDILRPGSAKAESFQQMLVSSLSLVADGALHVPDIASAPMADALHSFVRTAHEAECPDDPYVALPAEIDRVERGCYSRLRRARNLSLAETLGKVRDRTGIICSKDTLRRFESGTGTPHDPLLPAALDETLGGTGRLALSIIRTGYGDGAAKVPDWWSGPVWISFDRSDGIQLDGCIADLEWSGWRRTVRGPMPMTAIMHGGPIELRVLADRAVRWAVGIGRPVGAVPIDQGWMPMSLDTTREAIQEYTQALTDAIAERVAPPEGP